MDFNYVFELAEFFLRCIHMITAIAWIGASFYFVMLDNSLMPTEHADLKEKCVDGERWAVHGGSFYHSNKYMVAPRWPFFPYGWHLRRQPTARHLPLIFQWSSPSCSSVVWPATTPSWPVKKWL